jgi:hypothetical protein
MLRVHGHADVAAQAEIDALYAEQPESVTFSSQDGFVTKSPVEQ